MNLSMNQTTIRETSMVKAALRQKLRDGGIANPRVASALQSVTRCVEDEVLLDVCFEFMQEISSQIKSSPNGCWKWEHPVEYSTITNELMLICEIVGCWLGDDRFYVNQNHEDWR